MSKLEHNMSLTGDVPKSLGLSQKLAAVLGIAGLFILVLAGFNTNFPNKTLWLTISLSASAIGILWYSCLLYTSDAADE